MVLHTDITTSKIINHFQKKKLKILICHPLHLNLKVKTFQINFTLCKIPEVYQPISHCESLKTYKVTLVKKTDEAYIRQ